MQKRPVQKLPTDQELQDLVASTLDVDPSRVTADADLFVDLGADSLAVASLLAALEERLQLRFDSERFLEVETVSDLHTIVRETIESAVARES